MDCWSVLIFFSRHLGLNLVFPLCFVFCCLLITGAGVLLVSFGSNAGVPWETWSLSFAQPNLRSPWQNGLSLPSEKWFNCRTNRFVWNALPASWQIHCRKPPLIFVWQGWVVFINSPSSSCNGFHSFPLGHPFAWYLPFLSEAFGDLLIPLAMLLFRYVIHVS